MRGLWQLGPELPGGWRSTTVVSCPCARRVQFRSLRSLSVSRVPGPLKAMTRGPSGLPNPSPVVTQGHLGFPGGLEPGRMCDWKPALHRESGNMLSALCVGLCGTHTDDHAGRLSCTSPGHTPDPQLKGLHLTAAVHLAPDHTAQGPSPCKDNKCLTVLASCPGHPLRLLLSTLCCRAAPPPPGSPKPPRCPRGPWRRGQLLCTAPPRPCPAPHLLRCDCRVVKGARSLRSEKPQLRGDNR